MKMFTCIKPIKTTLFSDKVERIEVKKDTDWFLVKNETDDRVILSNNKIELTIAKKILYENFKQWR